MSDFVGQRGKVGVSAGIKNFLWWHFSQATTKVPGTGQYSIFPRLQRIVRDSTVVVPFVLHSLRSQAKER